MNLMLAMKLSTLLNQTTTTIKNLELLINKIAKSTWKEEETEIGFLAKIHEQNNIQKEKEDKEKEELNKINKKKEDNLSKWKVNKTPTVTEIADKTQGTTATPKIDKNQLSNGKLASETPLEKDKKPEETVFKFIKTDNKVKLGSDDAKFDLLKKEAQDKLFLLGLQSEETQKQEENEKQQKAKLGAEKFKPKPKVDTLVSDKQVVSQNELAKESEMKKVVLEKPKTDDIKKETLTKKTEAEEEKKEESKVPSTKIQSTKGTFITRNVLAKWKD